MYADTESCWPAEPEWPLWSDPINRSIINNIIKCVFEASCFGQVPFSIDTTIFACIYFCLCSSVKPSALRVLDLNICTYIRKHDGKGFPSWFYGLVVFVLILIS